MSNAESFSPTALQAAVDDIELSKVVGAAMDRATIVGIDIVPGIVVTQANGTLEAPGIVYMEIGSGGRSSSQRATIQFHVANDTVVVDRVLLAERRDSKSAL
ncbi:MAG: hypothetical protein JSR98_20850 [Proteobacteria bacterium]|nr:hypothetical protein [Pseudomonadota bacterium]